MVNQKVGEEGGELLQNARSDQRSIGSAGNGMSLPSNSGEDARCRDILILSGYFDATGIDDILHSTFNSSQG